jgi:hypothetical protein
VSPRSVKLTRTRGRSPCRLRARALRSSKIRRRVSGAELARIEGRLLPVVFALLSGRFFHRGDLELGEIDRLSSQNRALRSDGSLATGIVAARLRAWSGYASRVVAARASTVQLPVRDRGGLPTR